MRLSISIIVEELICKYNMLDKVKNGHVNICIDKCMYGLSQSDRLENDLLAKRLTPRGYHPVDHTNGLWRHEKRQIAFTLAVDDGGVKYVGEENTNHLLNALKEHYEVMEYWAG
jgi:hypothetical protein